MPDDIHDPIYLDSYRRSINQPTDFWEKLGHMIDWMRPWDRVLDDTNPPFTKWYVGGYLNACYNAVDRHVNQGKGTKVAIIHDSPMTNTVRHVTYQELYDQVCFILMLVYKNNPDHYFFVLLKIYRLQN